VRAKIVKAIIGMSQQKKAMMKHRLTSSVSIFFTSPNLTIRTIPRAAIPTTTIDQPTMSHLKKSDKTTPYSKKINCQQPRVKLPAQGGASRARGGEQDASKRNFILIVPLPACGQAGTPTRPGLRGTCRSNRLQKS